MADPVFLRGRDGAPIGPLSPMAVEILFGTRVIDESTPVSEDGQAFDRLDAAPELLARAESARAQLLEGGDPWREAHDTGDLEGPLPDLDLTESSALQVLFGHAVAKHEGLLTFENAEGTVDLTLAEGKIVSVDTAVERLALGAYLLAFGHVKPADLEAAQAAAPERFGGDLGGALIGLGAVAPHVYVEKYAEWAKTVVADVVGWDEGIARFTPGDAAAPAIPLGLDRFSALVDATRRALDKTRLMARLASAWSLPLIPRSVEGVTLEDLRLPPRDLRVIKGIDGSKTLGELVEKPGADAALAAVYAVMEAGFAVPGEDPQTPRDLEEAQKALAQVAAWKKKSPLEVIGVKAEASDDEVRARYMVLAKQYHPDGVRHGAPEALVDARRHLFAAMQAAYDQIDTADKRESFRQLASMGVATKADEQAIVRAVLEAETMFKKAEILARMRKYGEALELLEGALKRKPDDPEFRIHRTYYRHMIGKAETEAAIKEITAELKKQPNIASGFLFVARLHKQADNLEGAMKAYKKVLDLDERNHEAESELRLAAMRKDKQAKKKWL